MTTNTSHSNVGVSWDESEHLAFLKGLQVFGKGQWKQISRYYVPTRTPTQVASHAQKHFLRLSGNTKRRSKFTVVEQNAIASGISLFNGASGSGECQGEGERCGGSGSVSDTKKDVSEYMHGDGGLSKRVKIEDSPQQYQVLRPRVAIPPIDSNGMALGIPLPEIPELKSYDERKAIPMLKVLPGRIKASCTVFKPSSPSPSQKQTKSSESCERKTSRYHRPTRMKRDAIVCEQDVEESECKDDATGGGRSALDALAGVAAALADDETLL